MNIIAVSQAVEELSADLPEDLVSGGTCLFSFCPSPSSSNPGKRVWYILSRWMGRQFDDRERLRDGTGRFSMIERMNTNIPTSDFFSVFLLFLFSAKVMAYLSITYEPRIYDEIPNICSLSAWLSAWTGVWNPIHVMFISVNGASPSLFSQFCLSTSIACHVLNI